MKTAIEVLDSFENVRRAQRAGIYAPHKPLLILLALARVQRGEPRLVEFTAIDGPMKQLLAEFGPAARPSRATTRFGTWPPMVTAHFGT